MYIRLSGLGSSTSDEGKEYFTDIARHRIPFSYDSTDDDASINLAFSKKKVEERKAWLTNWMESKKRRQELGLEEVEHFVLMPRLFQQDKSSANASRRIATVCFIFVSFPILECPVRPENKAAHLFRLHQQRTDLV